MTILWRIMPTLIRLLGYSKQKIPPKELFRLEKFNLSSGAQVKPCRSGLRTGWVTHREYRLKGPYVVLSFLLLFFCALCGRLLLTVYWKAELALFLRPDLENEKSKEQIWPGAVRPKITDSSGRNTELELCTLWSIYRRGNRQSKKSGFSTV